MTTIVSTENQVKIGPITLPMSRSRLRENVWGYVFMLPWLIGFFGLFLGPALAALYFSFTEYNVIRPPEFVGLDNYVEMFTEDRLFWDSLRRTFYFAIFSVFFGVLGSMILAIVLNNSIRGIVFFRTLFFMPTLVPIVATAILWVILLNADFGIVNLALKDLGVKEPPGWFSSRDWAIPSMILMRLWGSIGGVQMIIFLAGLQSIPQSLYDAASVDGANVWHRVRHVTIPLLTPMIFLNTVLGIIGAMQTFEAAFVATEGGPGYATWFFSLHIYKQTFDFFNMGYGTALAWFFAGVIILITLLQQWFSRRWVFYYGA